MARDLTAIETIVAFESGDSDIDLNTEGGEGIEIANLVYRRLANAYPWPELNREDTSLTTVENQEKYILPSHPIFYKVHLLEVEDPDDGKYRVVPPMKQAIHSLQFALLRREDPSFPCMYKKISDGTNHNLVFAPAPADTGLKIRITGKIEPDSLTDSNTTFFESENGDDAFCYLLAIEFEETNMGDQRRSMELMSKANDILQALFPEEDEDD